MGKALGFRAERRHRAAADARGVAAPAPQGRPGNSCRLLLLSCLTGRGEAMSLSVSICMQMNQYGQDKMMQCLRDSFHEVVEAHNIEEKNAALRLGRERGTVLIATEKSRLAATAEHCKAHLHDDIIDTAAESTDFECLIDETNRRIAELRQVAYKAWGDEP
jgi:uncharacterized protein YecT (DUF1311 family)